MIKNLVDSLVPDYIQDFTPYHPSRPDSELMRLYGLDRLYRLNNNENPLGPPPDARKAISSFPPERGAVYPSGDAYYLLQALAAKLGKESEQFLVGNGSCEVIASVIKSFCEAGDNIVTADKTFAVYEWVAQFSGVEARLVPLNNFAFDPEAMLEAIDERTKIVFVCNPNNPTGTYWDTSTMEDFLDEVQDRIVVIDEAYFEYVDETDYPDGMRLMDKYPNVLVFRTFSKMYGLAALRIGYLCADRELADIVRRAHIVYSVNSLAQEAAVAALLNDAGHIRESRNMVRRAREIMTRQCERLGLEYQSGEGNYFMLKTPLSDTYLYRRLIQRSFMVRAMTGFRFPGWVRVTLREEEVMGEFCEALEDVLRNVGR